MGCPRFSSLLFLLSVCLGCVKNPANPEANYNIATKRVDDTVAVIANSKSAVFDIRSPFGISEISISRLEPRWPEHVQIRLHLSGLEKLQLSVGQSILHASVSSHQTQPIVRLWMDKMEENAIDSTSPYWMEVQLFDRDRKPTSTIPLTDGYFEMELPQALFASNPKSIEVDWIDFYRR